MNSSYLKFALVPLQGNGPEKLGFLKYLLSIFLNINLSISSLREIFSLQIKRRIGNKVRSLAFLGRLMKQKIYFHFISRFMSQIFLFNDKDILMQGLMLLQKRRFSNSHSGIIVKTKFQFKRMISFRLKELKKW